MAIAVFCSKDFCKFALMAHFVNQETSGDMHVKVCNATYQMCVLIHNI